MHKVDYEELFYRSWDMPLIQQVGQLHEFRGRQALLQGNTEKLESMQDAASVASAETSQHLDRLLSGTSRNAKDTGPAAKREHNRLAETAAYGSAVEFIQESYPQFRVVPAMIRQLQRFLCAASEPMGYSEEVRENVVEMPPLVGSQSTASAALGVLCSSFDAARSSGLIEPLLLIPEFILDFIRVAPFASGNGRLAALLLTLLLEQEGFIVPQYVSLESEMERSASRYRDIIREALTGWEDNKNNPTKFTQLILGTLIESYDSLEAQCPRVSQAESPAPPKMEQAAPLEIAAPDTAPAIAPVPPAETEVSIQIRREVYTAAEEVGEHILSRNIFNLRPKIPRPLVQKALKELTERGALERHGKGRGTYYTMGSVPLDS